MKFVTLPLAVLMLFVSASFVPPIASLVVTSPAFTNNNPIPVKYTCAGEEFSPPINIANIPQNARSLAIIVYDPDGIKPAAKAATAPKETKAKKKKSKKPIARYTAATMPCGPSDNCFVYWMVWNVDVNNGSIPENFKNETEGLNSANTVGYKGMCAGTGTHYYHFRVYALDTKLNIDKKSSKAALEKYMQGHILASGELVGTFNKSYK